MASSNRSGDTVVEVGGGIEQQVRRDSGGGWQQVRRDLWGWGVASNNRLGETVAEQVGGGRPRQHLYRGGNFVCSKTEISDYL